MPSWPIDCSIELVFFDLQHVQPSFHSLWCTINGRVCDVLTTSPTCNNYGSTFYVTHVISHTRLPLFSRVCVEKIGEPGNEAISDGQRRKGKGEGIHVPKSQYLAILMVRNGQTDGWTKVITLLLVHVHGTTPLQEIRTRR